MGASLNMRAVICDGVGAATVMHLGEVARPVAGAGQVLIRVHAAGVNRPDVLQRQGLYAPPTDASPILGLEVAGVIVAGDVGGCLQLGDAVCALTHGGGYAEYVVAERAQCLPIPHGWSMVASASLPETFFTVWLNVFDRAHLGRDRSEILLVHAGASGIGVAAIQMARAMGQTVWVTASSALKREACMRLGASGALDGRSTDWVEFFLNATNGHGADVVLDMIGGDSLAHNVQVLALGGRLAWIAFLGGARSSLNIPQVMAKELVLAGVYLRRQSQQVKARIAQELYREIWPKIERGDILPTVDRVFPMEDVVLAHKYMESSRHIGKIILVWSSVAEW